MDRFKNEHLENLWANLLPYFGGTCTACEIADIVKLFEECDTAIEDEADDCGYWRTMYGKTCKEVDLLKESISLRDRVIDKFRTTKTAVEKERDEYKSLYESLCKYLGEWRNSKASDDFADPQELRAEYSSLKESLDILKKSNEALLSANMDLAMEKRKLEDSLNYAMIQQLEARIEELTAQLKDANNKADRCEKDLDDAKKQMGYFTTSRDNWRSRAKHAEDEVEDLKKKLNFQQNTIDGLRKGRDELQKERAELSKVYVKLSGENKKLNARLDCLRGEAKFYRNHYKEQSAKIGELKSRLNSMYGVKYGEYVRSRDTGYKNGQTDLWDMLQNVNDMKLDGFDPECETLGDIIDMDLEDFLDAYKIWHETKEHERIIKDACDAFYYGFKAGLASEVPIDRN